jgi:CheY-specific phosphatase CheX
MTDRSTHYEELLGNALPRVMNEVLVALLEETAINPVLLNVPSQQHTPIACRVRIGGSFDGEVIVSATLALANRIAAHMFADDLDGKRPPTAREARAAMREVANIVAGNLKPLLGENNQLGLPEDLAESAPPTAADPVLRATLEHRAGALDVVVYTSL